MAMTAQQQKLWPDVPSCAPLEKVSPKERDELRALCMLANHGRLSELVSEMVEGGICEDGREWLRMVLEVRA